MTIYNSTDFATKAPVAVHGEANNIQAFRKVVTCAAAPATGDVLNFGYIAPNAVVLGGYLKCSDMDTGGPTLTIDIGTTASAQLFWAASVAGGNGTVDTTMAAVGRGYKNTTGAKQLIVGTAHANATTPAAGTVEVHLSYYVEDLSTSG